MAVTQKKYTFVRELEYKIVCATTHKELDACAELADRLIYGRHHILAKIELWRELLPAIKCLEEQNADNPRMIFQHCLMTEINKLREQKRIDAYESEEC